MSQKLTKADSRALWHAVESQRYQVQAMQKMDGITPELQAAEEARLKASQYALRKIQAQVRSPREAP